MAGRAEDRSPSGLLASLGAVSIPPSEGESQEHWKEWGEVASEKAVWEELPLWVGDTGVNTLSPLSLGLPSPADTSHWLDILGRGRSRHRDL